jgi:hypothetical protein
MSPIHDRIGAAGFWERARGPLRNVFGSLLIARATLPASLPPHPPTSITLAIDELEPIQRMLRRERAKSYVLCFGGKRARGETLSASCAQWLFAAPRKTLFFWAKRGKSAFSRSSGREIERCPSKLFARRCQTAPVGLISAVSSSSAEPRTWLITLGGNAPSATECPPILYVHLTQCHSQFGAFIKW